MLTGNQWPDKNCIQLVGSDNPSSILFLFVSLQSDSYSHEKKNEKRMKNL